jgi:hypothetical protein
MIVALKHGNDGIVMSTTLIPEPGAAVEET